MKYYLGTITLFLVVALSFSPHVAAQIGVGDLDGRVNTVFTAIPFLRINPDTRTGAMGDVGIATDVDASALYHNVAKLAYAPSNAGLTVNYTPWLKELVSDIFIAQVAGYVKLDDLQSIGLSARYFSLGNINFTDITGQDIGSFSPNEFAIDLGYARKLSTNFSTGITLKYVRSDLASGQDIGAGNIVNAAQAVAADLGFFYRNPDLTIGGKSAELSLGAAITNIGNKVSYTQDDTKDFIPTNLGIGSNLKFELDEHNTLAIAFDINKLMVPTPDSSFNNNPTDPENPRNKPLISGMFGSFGDAPGGFSEEMQELMYSVGLEYWYNKQFAVRAGYFNEHRLKGNRKFLTLGVGLRYSVFGLNFSYIVPTTSQRNPLDNTLRFALTFDFNGAGSAKEILE
jgi:hypothetical protein